MKLDKNKLVKELYEKYIFIAKKDDIFRKIVLESIPNDATYEEALDIAKKNIINNIIYRMNNRLFTRLFDRTVQKMGIENAFDFYNTIIQETGMKVNLYDMIKISEKDEYDSFFKKANSNGNKLLEEVLDLYNSDIDIDVNSNSYITPEVYEYIKYITKNYKLLKSREEELELISKYRQTNDKEYKDEFINSNLRLVVAMALKRHKHLHFIGKEIDLQDLIQAGNIGLLKAFDKFDENKGFKFSTYARWWINNEIFEFISSETDTIKIPMKMFLDINKINKFKGEYMYKHGTLPSNKEIMDYMEIDEEEFDKLRKAEMISNVASYDIPIQSNIELEDNIDITDIIKTTSEIEYLEEQEVKEVPLPYGDFEEINYDDEINAIDLVPDEESINIEDAIIEDAFTDQMLAYAKKTLNKNENKVILETCGFNIEQEEKSRVEIGKKLNVTHERIRRIEIDAIYKLQKNSAMINNGIQVEQEYYLLKDIKKILKQNNISSIDVISHSICGKTSTFECGECGKEFKEEVKKILETLECPYCREKQLIEEERELKMGLSDKEKNSINEMGKMLTKTIDKTKSKKK